MFTGGSSFNTTLLTRKTLKYWLEYIANKKKLTLKFVKMTLHAAISVKYLTRHAAVTLPNQVCYASVAFCASISVNIWIDVLRSLPNKVYRAVIVLRDAISVPTCCGHIAKSSMLRVSLQYLNRCAAVTLPNQVHYAAIVQYQSRCAAVALLN
jgi:hypothetical protein